MRVLTLKNGRTCHIRPATVEDALGLVNFVRTVAGESDNLTFGRDEFHMTVEDEVRFLHSLQGQEHQQMLVATVSGKIVGNIHIQGGTRQRRKHIASFGISVLKEFWGTGVGKALMEELLKHAERLSLTRIELRVRTDNERAIALYRHFGFEAEGVERRAMLIDGKYVDFLMMGLLID